METRESCQSNLGKGSVGHGMDLLEACENLGSYFKEVPVPS